MIGSFLAYRCLEFYPLRICGLVLKSSFSRALEYSRRAEFTSSKDETMTLRFFASFLTFAGAVFVISSFEVDSLFVCFFLINATLMCESKFVLFFLIANVLSSLKYFPEFNRHFQYFVLLGI